VGALVHSSHTHPAATASGQGLCLVPFLRGNTMLAAAAISFVGIALLLSHIPSRWARRLAGYAGPVDVLLHGALIYMFIGTSTVGLLQAEAAGICVSLLIRAYRWLLGCEKLTLRGWKRVAGALT